MKGFYGFPAVHGSRRPKGIHTFRSSVYVASRYAEERWMTSNLIGTAPTASSPSVNSLRCAPIVFTHDAVIDKISYNVTVAGGAGSVSMVGIYDTDGDSWYPGNLLWNSVSTNTNSTTGVISQTLCLPVQANKLYWLAFNCGTAAPQCRCQSNASSWTIGGEEDTMGTTPGNFITVSSTYSANGMPTYFPSGAAFPASSGPFMPMIGIRLSA